MTWHRSFPGVLADGETLSRWSRVTAAAAVVAACSLALAPATAHACGGLFCDASQPVNQAAERILFSQNGDGSVTAVIEIQYQGPSERFSWILPIPGVPDVEVSSVAAFDRLQQATNPSYQLNRTFEDCGDFGGGGTSTAFGGAGGTGAGFAADAGAAEGPGVIVLAAGSVGPYDYEVISLTGMPSDPAEVALDWLMDNGYDVTDLGPDVLRPYLEEGLNLLAFRLTKSADTGSIRPVMITYDSESPFIPIRPTAVAANDDMGILVWVTSRARAIPLNYKALELNEALINWFNPMTTYNEVVSAAADEAAGQGFVTELAATTDTLENVIVQSWERSEWSRIQSQSYADPLDLLQEVSNNFFGWDGLEDALRAAVTLPMGLDLASFLECPNCFADDPGVVIDEDALLTALYVRVIKPMFNTDELLLSRPYVTRLYTTMSANEMTMDPAFDTNMDLSDVSNVHMAEQYIRCDGSWTVALPQGGMVHGTDQSVWPDMADQPANFKILQLSTEGQGETVEDNADKIAALLEAAAPPDAGAPPGGGGRGGAGAGDRDGGTVGLDDGGVPGTRFSGNDCGCRVPGAPDKRAPVGPAWLAGLVVVLARARARRRVTGAR
jgi:hypothetical protein